MPAGRVPSCDQPSRAISVLVKSGNANAVAIINHQAEARSLAKAREVEIFFVLGKTSYSSLVVHFRNGQLTGRLLLPAAPGIGRIVIAPRSVSEPVSQFGDFVCRFPGLTLTTWLAVENQVLREVFN